MRREVDGYVTDVQYVFDYYKEIAPSWLRLLVQSRGLAFPSGPLRYLELGYGTGVSLNLHAAANPGEFWGSDVNRDHAATANALAANAATGAKALGLAFADLLGRADLPQFNVVAALGVWSWVSDASRRQVVEILRRHLVDGGIVCLSSLTLAGNAELIGLQRLLRRVAVSGEATTLAGLDRGLQLAAALKQAGSAYFAGGAGALLDEIMRARRDYLVHEYLHAHWRPALFSDTATELAEAGLQFVASAYPLHHYDELSVGPKGVALLEGIADPLLQETARDFLRKGRLRYDIFIKQGAPVRRAVDPAAIREQQLVLLQPSRRAKLQRLHSAGGELAFDAPPFAGVIDFLASDSYRPKTLGELSEAGLEGATTAAELLRAVMVLLDDGIASPAQPAAARHQVTTACHRLNRELLQRSLESEPIEVLASPVSGSGVPLSLPQRLFVLATHQGARTADQRARSAFDALQAQAAERQSHRPGQEPLSTAVLKEALLFNEQLPCLAALGLI